MLLPGFVLAWLIFFFTFCVLIFWIIIKKDFLKNVSNEIVQDVFEEDGETFLPIKWKLSLVMPTYCLLLTSACFWNYYRAQPHKLSRIQSHLSVACVKLKNGQKLSPVCNIHRNTRFSQVNMAWNYGVPQFSWLKWWIFLLIIIIYSRHFDKSFS